MTFNRDNPGIRVAVLVPGTGLALSRDSGTTWVPLDITQAGPVVAGPTMYQPRSAFYDPTLNPKTGSPSIYVALHDSGIIRVDGPFPAPSQPHIIIGGSSKDYLPVIVRENVPRASAALPPAPGP
jgi:hypothetical protein